MTTAFTYILKWALCLAMLYIPFALLLRKETFATFNRILLLGIIAISALLPTIVVTFPVEVEIVKLIDATGNTISESPVATVPPTDMSQVVPVADRSGFSLKYILDINTLLIIYLAGVVITFTLRIVEIVKIVLGIRHCTILAGKRNGMTLHFHTDDGAPFSWFGHTVISRNDYKECGNEILLHEEGHYRHGHSWDMLLLSVMKSLQWFNPFAYMLANDMKEIHEYEADRYVLKHHGNTSAYQLLLLKKALGDTLFNLANNFSQSCVKKRIMMMSRKPSAWIHKGKTLVMAPMILLFLFIFAKPEYVYSVIEERALPATDDTGVEMEKIITPHLPAIERAPQPLQIPIARIGKPSDDIEPMVPVQLNEKAKRYIERNEEHATKTYFEQIDISGSEVGDRLRSMNVKQCSARVKFIADKEGNAHSITSKGCNVSFAGSSNEVGNSIEECKREATEAVERYVQSRKWQTAMEQGKSFSTIYDAHIILSFEEADNDTAYNGEHTMMAGSTPIN